MNISFKGYDNVCAGELFSSDGYIRILSARLNNDGVPDLDNFRKFIKDYNLNPNILNGDIITLIHTKSDELTRFDMGTQTFYDAYSLKEIQKQSNLKNVPKSDFIGLEKIHLRFYTMIADLTKRMSNHNDQMFYSDSEKTAVKDSIKKTFFTLTEDETFTNNVMKLFDDVFPKTVHFQEIAGKMNRFIHKSFIHYFK